MGLSGPFWPGWDSLRKTVRMGTMNHSTLKTLLYAALALSGGFAVLCFLERDSSWFYWTIGFCALLAFFLYRFHPKKTAPKEPEVQSVLPEEAVLALDQGKRPDLASPLKLRAGEHLLWADQMRTDYYNSRPHLFYLTTSRLVCLDEDFRFSHSLKDLSFTFAEDRVRIQTPKSKMDFKTASPRSMEQAWKLVLDSSSRREAKKQK